MEGYGQQPARVETGTHDGTAQKGTLPEVRENINSYPCHDFEHWSTPPPRVGGGIGMQEVCPPPLVTFVPRIDHHSRDIQASTIPEANPNHNLDQLGLVQSVTQLMQAQTNMLTAYAQVVAMQNLPSLSPFTGEDPHSDEDNFEK